MGKFLVGTTFGIGIGATFASAIAVAIASAILAARIEKTKEESTTELKQSAA